MRRKCLRDFCEEHLRTFLATAGVERALVLLWGVPKSAWNPPRKASQTLCPLPRGQVPACFSCLFLFYVSVDNDPHFIIHLPKSQRNICFNINSEPGKILNLVSDPGTGKEIKRDLLYSTLFFSQVWKVFRGSRRNAYREDCVLPGVWLRAVVISLHIWSFVSSLRLASTRKLVTNWIKFSGGHQDDNYRARAQDIGETEIAGFGQS